ncbi:MAG: hypothetical protein Q9214_001512 [Letrouitia sp. 1 TL-2023]
MSGTVNPSTRLTRYRGEPPPKKRQLTPPPTPVTPKEHPKPVDDGLPVKLKEGQRLPTQPERQDPTLSVSEYQSISESGILAASVQQSRQKWMVEGVFERYWAKPSKKKAQPDSQNPAKETMSRLGICSMIIEPHVFETTLYTVKEPQTIFVTSKLPPPPPPPPPNPQYNPFQDHKTYAPQPHSPYSQSNQSHYLTQHQTSLSSTQKLPPFREGFGLFPSSGPLPYQNTAAPSHKPAESSQSGSTLDRSEPQLGDAANEGEKPTDPVIQMLATRAASDHNLKALMKVVASGYASQEQLRSFQNHIDELNDIIKSSKNPTQQIFNRDMNLTSNNTHSFPSTHHAGSSSPYTPPAAKPTPSTSYAAPSHPPALIKPDPLNQYYSHLAPPPPKPKPSVAYKPEISAIVFDFGGGGDRFSFPRLSILEYLPGGTQVIVSFLIIRKGSSTPKSSDYKDSLSYYQTVTLRLSTPNPRTLEPLARVVAPKEEVKKYMNGIFDKMNPAKECFLTMRLPRAKEDHNVEMADPPAPVTENIIKPFYDAPSFLAPLVA